MGIVLIGINLFMFIGIVIMGIILGLIGGKIAKDMGKPSWIGIVLGLLLGVIALFLNK